MADNNECLRDAQFQKQLPPVSSMRSSTLSLQVKSSVSERPVPPKRGIPLRRQMQFTESAGAEPSVLRFDQTSYQEKKPEAGQALELQVLPSVLKLDKLLDAESSEAFDSALLTVQSLRESIHKAEHVSDDKLRSRLDNLSLNNEDAEFLQAMGKLFQGGQLELANETQDWPTVISQRATLNEQTQSLNAEYVKEKQFRDGAQKLLDLYRSQDYSVEDDCKSGKLQRRRKVTAQSKSSVDRMLLGLTRKGAQSGESLPSLSKSSASTASVNQEDAVRAAAGAYFDSTERMCELGEQLVTLRETHRQHDEKMWQLATSQWLSIVERSQSLALKERDDSLLQDDRVRALCDIILNVK